ncbi:hypothetical protein HNY73_014586 [Argiope bruennichi]|uniref:Uncharacterized protein n=1 Tax=Argiope bruennichi TaxID=94029 RepID=A0A8T0EUS8_ARGBR|nr:hypothetical protein HNY73_014586 [Argiope bruennichi]
MAKTQLNVRQTRREQHLKNNSVNSGNSFNKNESSSTAYDSSTESLSSDSENIFKPFPLPIMKQNRQQVRLTHQQRNISVKTVPKNKKKSSNYRLNKRNFPKRLSSSATQTVILSGNQSPIVLYLLPSDQTNYVIHQFCEQPEDHVKSVSGSESLFSVSHSKLLKFHKNSKLSHPTSIAFDDPKSCNYEMKRCSDSAYEDKKKQAASSNTHKLILDCVRNCQSLLNMYRSFDCPTTSCKCRPCLQSLHFPVSHNTLKDHFSLEGIENISYVSRSINQSPTSPYPLFCISPIETTTFSSPSSTASHRTSQDISFLDERCHSLCSIGADVESLEITSRNMTRKLSKTEPISNEPPYGHPNGSFQPILKDSLKFLDETENVNQISRWPLNSENIFLEKNSTCCNSTLQRGDSPSSIVVEVGSMETTSGNKTMLPPKVKPLFDTSPGSPVIQTTSKEHWYIQDGSKSIRCPHDSFYHPSKGNITYSKLVPEERYRYNTALKNDNSSKSSSASRVNKQGTLQLAKEASPSSTSTSPFILNSSNSVQNATTSISQHSPYSTVFDRHSIIRCSNNSRAIDLSMEENGNSTLNSNDPSFAPFLCSEESFSFHDENPLAPPNTPIPLSSSEEMCFTGNIVCNKSQSLSSLSMMCCPPTPEVSEELVLSDELNSKHNIYKRNKTRKKSKFVSCFFGCLRPSSPQQDDLQEHNNFNLNYNKK